MLPEWKNQVGLGEVVATVALVFAALQLVRSRKDLIRECRADFLLAQLAELHRALHESSSELRRFPSDAVAERMMILPADLDLPVLRRWMETTEGAAEVVAGLGVDLDPYPTPQQWVSAQARREVQRAVDKLVAVRLPWWQRVWTSYAAAFRDLYRKRPDSPR